MQPSPWKILIGPLYHAQLLGSYLQDPRIFPFVLDGVRWSDMPPGYDMVAPQISSFQPLRRYHYASSRVSDLLAQFEPEEQPDLLIWWGLYAPLPVDLAESPIPTALVVSDWHENLSVLMRYITAFDYIFADRALVEILQLQGHRHCACWSSYALYPERSFLSVPAMERIWDVCYLGSLNFSLHPQREVYLQRLLKLTDRYRILIDTHRYGAEFNQILNQSRLVFNYSVRGEMNLRAFEASASGAVVLMEEENAEIRDYLPPGKACILYNAHNFESQIEYYLKHEAERQQMADYARQLVLQHTAAHQFARLLPLLSEVINAFQKHRSRAFLQLSPQQRQAIRVRQTYHLLLEKAPQVAVQEMKAWLPLSKHSLETLNLMAACLTDYEFNPETQRGQPFPLSAETVYAHLLQLYGWHPVVLTNAAWYCYFRGDPERALAYSRQANHVLSQADFEIRHLWDMLDAILPYGHNYFFLHWQRLVARILKNQSSLLVLRDFLSWNNFVLQARLWSQLHQPAMAEALYQQALSLFPELGTVGFELARMRREQGKIEQAMDTYRHYLRQHFFHAQAHQALLEMLLEQNQPQRVLDWLQEMEPIFRAVPRFREEQGQFIRLAKLAEFLVREQET